MTKNIGVLLMHDQPMTRAAIRATLDAEDDLTLLGEVTDSDETLRLCREVQPDILLLAVSIVDSSLVEVLTYLRQNCPTVKTLLLATDYDAVYGYKLMTAGVMGYILNNEAMPAVVLAIHCLAQGLTCLSSPVLDSLLVQSTGEHVVIGGVQLTRREYEVLQSLIQGLTNKEIGAELQIKETTVEFHVGNLMKKLKVASRTEAAVWAVEHHLANDTNG